MTPGDLKKLTSSINAICGLEFEMIVPVEKSDEEGGENDYFFSSISLSPL